MPTITGTSGDDVLSVTGGTNLVDGGDGNDTLTAFIGNDTLIGGAGNDTITADLETMVSIDAGDGNDIVNLGTRSADYTHVGSLSGGAGTDRLTIGYFVVVQGLSAASSGFEQIEFKAVTAGSGYNNLTGDAGDDLFDLSGFEVVGTANPYVAGGGGNDTLIGSLRADTLFGGDGDDTLRGGVGNDSLGGGLGTDTAVFSGNYADYTIIKLNATTYTITGADGTDTLNDIEYLQFADRRIAAAAVPVVGQTFNGTSGNDTIGGTAGNDVINGYGGNDLLYGEGGDDTINGGDGDDTVLGNSGNDVLYGGDGNDTVRGYTEGIQDEIGIGADYLDGGNGDDSLAGTNDSTLAGGAGNDTLDLLRASVNARADGGDGNDTLTIRDSDATTLSLSAFKGGAGIDTLVIQSLFHFQGTEFSARTVDFEQVKFCDPVVGGDGADLIDLSGFRVISGNSGSADWLHGKLITIDGGLVIGGGGNDTIIGSKLNDRLDGGAGNDTVYGGLGDDTILANASDWISGGYGDDTISTTWAAGETGTVTIAADQGHDVVNITFTGPGQGASVSGGAGMDTFNVSGHGAATLVGGDGNDVFTLTNISTATLTLGTGSDWVHLNAQDSIPFITITDFQTGAGGDVLDLDTYLDGALAGWDHKSNPFGNGLMRLTASGNDTMVQLMSAGSWTDFILLKNVAPVALTAENLSGFAPDGSAPTGYLISTQFRETLSYHNGASEYQNIYGLGGPDVVYANGDAYNLYGGAGDDTLFGNENAFTPINLYGGSGDDILIDGIYMEGGAGADTFVVYGDRGMDGVQIADFTPGVDSLVIYGFSGPTDIQFTPANVSSSGINSTQYTFWGTSGPNAIGNTGYPVRLYFNGLTAEQVASINITYIPGTPPAARPSAVASTDPVVAIVPGNHYESKKQALVAAGTTYFVSDSRAVSNYGPGAISGFNNGHLSAGDDLDVTNRGRIVVVSDNCNATGVYSYGYEDTVTNYGEIDVWAGMVATGVYTIASTSFVNNAGGVIDVEGGWSAQAVCLGMIGDGYLTLSFANAGTITAKSDLQNSVAVTLGTFAASFTNSGTISGDYALYVYLDLSYALFRPDGGAPIVNSGQMNGKVLLSAGNDVLRNTGQIHGAIDLGLGNDTYDGAGGYQTGGVYGGYGNDTLTGGAGDEYLFGDEDDDIVSGGGGDDYIDGGRGRNALDGGDGTDTLSFESLNAPVTASLAAGSVSVAGASDTIANFENLVGSQFGDTLSGDGAANRIDGGAGDDVLSGGGGTDSLTGGTGDDLLTGGSGGDVFVFQAGDGNDTITDFTAGSDHVYIQGDASYSSLTQVGADVLVTYGAGDTIRLENVTLAALTARDFWQAPISTAANRPQAPLPVGYDLLEPLHDYTIAAGETFDFSGHEFGIFLAYNPLGTPPCVVTNNGTVMVSAAGDVYGIDMLNSNGTFTNGASGTFTVSDTNWSGAAHGTWGTGLTAFTNAGTFTVTSTNDAIGISPEGNGFYAWMGNFSNTGLFSVTADGDAAGIVYAGALNGYNSITNDGQFRVRGGGLAVGISYYDSYGADPASVALLGITTLFSNTGTFDVSAEAAGASAIGIQYDRYAYSTARIANSGTIHATTAINVTGTAPDYATTWARALTIDNSGRIEGDIVLSALAGTINNSGTIAGDIRFGDFASTYDGRLGQIAGGVFGGSGNDTLSGGNASDLFYGLAGNDTLFGGSEHDTLTGGAGNDTLDGGSNIDTAVFAGNFAAYTITQGAAGVFTVSGTDGTDTLSNVEFAQFGDQTVRLLPGTGAIIDWSADPSTYMAGIRDFDGNDLGAASGWKLIGTADVNGDGTVEHILVNRQNGRWAEISTEADGKSYLNNFGWAGDSRVVGIYIDPLVASGEVVAGGDFDSQRRFQNDLNIENIHGVLGQNDYNHDGLQEIYFSLTDGTAYLHAYMHADGNIQYANYQNEQQVKDYLTANGFTSAAWAGWFPAAQTALAAVVG